MCKIFSRIWKIKESWNIFIHVDIFCVGSKRFCIPGTYRHKHARKVSSIVQSQLKAYLLNNALKTIIKEVEGYKFCKANQIFLNFLIIFIIWLKLKLTRNIDTGVAWHKGISVLLALQCNYFLNFKCITLAY